MSSCSDAGNLSFHQLWPDSPSVRHQDMEVDWSSARDETFVVAVVVAGHLDREVSRMTLAEVSHSMAVVVVVVVVTKRIN